MRHIEKVLAGALLLAGLSGTRAAWAGDMDLKMTTTAGASQVTFQNVAASTVGFVDSYGNSSFMPIGSMIAFGGTSAPSGGWLICNGAAVSRVTYAALFTAIGTAYGNGDGSTTFNLPDMPGRLP